jgi:hypothetical protein
MKSAGHGDHWINSVEKLVVSGWRTDRFGSAAGLPPATVISAATGGVTAVMIRIGAAADGVQPVPAQPVSGSQPAGIAPGYGQGRAERRPRLLIDCSGFIRHNERHVVPTS